MDHAHAVRILEEVDARTREERADRLRWLERHGEPQEGRLLTGGYAAATAWWEAGACFVAGQYLAVILLCQSCLEHLLVGALHIFAADENAHKLNAQKLFARALERDVLTQEEFELFDGHRRHRNPHAHPRGMDDPSNIMRRMMDTKTPADAIYEQDARDAVEGLKALLDRPPFAVGPLVPSAKFPPTEGLGKGGGSASAPGS